MHQQHDKNLIWGIVASFVIHLGAVGGMFAMSKQANGEAPVKIEAVTAVLVRKGKERSKKDLPRRFKMLRPKVKRRRPVVRKRKKPRRRRFKEVDLDKMQEKLMKRLNKKAHNEEDKYAELGERSGSRSGSDHGNTDDASLARQGSVYLAKIGQKIESNFTVPNIINDTREKRYRKKIQVIIYLTREGRVKSVKMVRSSGNRVFDSALISAIRRASPFDRPPKSIWKQIKRGGIVPDLSRR